MIAVSVREQISTAWLFRKVRTHPNLDALLGHLECGNSSLQAGWGYRPSGLSAKKIARKSNHELLILEDAFVRSMKPGGRHVYGLVADSQGIYYDRDGKSDLIESLNSGHPEGWMRNSKNLPEDIARLIVRFRRSRISKYNWYPGDQVENESCYNPGVLVVDQTKGDASLSHGALRPDAFDQMIRDALDENPNRPVYLRAHPDHRYRGKHSCFDPWVFSEPRIKILPPDLSPAMCLEFCDVVYVATSLLGMEALIHGKTVKTYGWNFYAGWGLTEDRSTHPKPPRRLQLDLTRLFEAAYLQYSHFFDPDTGEPCELDRILDHLELQQKIAAENSGTKITLGWDPWKRAISQKFFNSPGCHLIHAVDPKEALQLKDTFGNAKLLLWGAEETLDPSASSFIRVEDGFLRSAGLGATFHQPFSWVCDEIGIYFDSAKPSKLESLLETGEFSSNDLRDAENLASILKKNRLSKYNLKDSTVSWKKSEARGKKIIMVPGQVEQDASIKKGSPEIRTNHDLLARVRTEEPDAFLIFKCHPDLVANARHGQLLPEEVEAIANLVVTSGNVIEWLELCDEVHTMTSTVGFEAILRGIPVITYGMPFYAGWGLTRDHLTCDRRTRRVTVPELVCATLICYPRYINPHSGEFTTALHVAKLLATGAIVENRPWYLRFVSILKGLWVRLRRR